jgi:hypothetical protein
MIKFDTDPSDYLTLSQAAKILPRKNGRRIHSSTLWRWARRGCRGTFLKYWRIGRTVVTTESALHQFFAELGKADTAQAEQQSVVRKRRPRRCSSARRQQAIQKANETLIKAGILQTQSSY